MKNINEIPRLWMIAKLPASPKQELAALLEKQDGQDTPTE